VYVEDKRSSGLAGITLVAHPNIREYGIHVLCWFDNLEEPAKGIVKGLVGADSNSGSTSDYCN